MRIVAYGYFCSPQFVLVIRKCLFPATSLKLATISPHAILYMQQHIEEKKKLVME